VRIAAALTWVVIINAIFTVMLARLEQPDVTRAQVVEILNAPGAKPLANEDAHKLLDEENSKYTPYAANQLYFRPRGTDSNFYPPVDQPGGLSIISGISGISGRGRVLSQTLRIAHREFQVENEESALARIETYAYPHWVARLDGREARIDVERGTGLMTVALPAGVHRLTLDYEIRQTSQRAAIILSAVAWGVFLIWIVARGVRHTIRKKAVIQ
jgi:hypothetical protein